MKVLSYNCTAFGGGARVVFGINKKAVENEMNCSVIISYGKKNEIYEYTMIGNRMFNAINSRISKYIGVSYEFISYNTKKLIKSIRNEKPDIIHLHGIHNTLNYKKLFKFLNKYRKAVIWTQHDCCAFTGKCPYYTIVNCDKWQTMCHKCPQLDEYPITLHDATKHNYKSKNKIYNSINSDLIQIVTVSNWLNSQVKQSILSKFESIVIENGVDINIFKYKNNNIREKNALENNFIILSVASGWSRRKGIEDIYELSKRLKNTISNAIHVVIGCNDIQLKECESLGILAYKRMENIQDLVDWYSAADVFYNPSMEETFGLVTVEAMACGLPILGYNSTSFPEICQGEVGYSVDPHDLSEVIDRLNLILRNGKNAYSENCINRVLSKYNSEIQYSKYLELYKEKVIKEM